MSVGIRCPACQHKFIPAAQPADGRLACPACARQLKLPRPADPSDPLVGRTIAGYQLLKRLGTGAMAAVYQARPLAGGAHVAIKMLTSDAAKDEETVARFRREAELAHSLTHPHVVAVSGNGTENGVHWMALELVAGISLEAAIDRRQRLPWIEAVQVVLQIGEALVHLNARGILHRDVKPANILLTADGTAKLTDLGFAKSVGPSVGQDDAAGLTMAGMAMGSPAYMAPEQVLDAKAVTHSADVYGLGATLYHAVTGETPFSGRNAYEVMEKVVKEDPVPPRTYVPDLPAGLAAFLLWSLTKDPARRPRDAVEFVSALNAVVAAPEDVQRFTQKKAGLRGRDILALLLAGGLLSATAAWWFSRG